jgi:hypothetical protein
MSNYRNSTPRAIRLVDPGAGAAALTDNPAQRDR